MVIPQVMELESAGLANVLRCPNERDRTLVLDCRPLFAFSRHHISGSRAVSCGSVLLRRRLLSRAHAGGRLAALLPQGALVARLRHGELSTVVVLDEASDSVQGLRTDSPAGLLLSALISEMEPGGARVAFLKGGFESFYASFPDLCSQLEVLCSSVPGDSEDGLHARSTPLHDQGGPVEILPFLYLGSTHHSSRKDMLDTLGITALLNVSSNCPNYFEGHFCYKSIPVEDSHGANISIWFQEAIDYIDSVKSSGGRVLVHCHAGISRSATICLAYLIRTQRVRLEEAFDFVKQRRGVISPNFGFMGQLLQFETEVLCH